MPFEIKKEQPKDTLVTMGQADKEIEYEDYYPPGATEPIRRPKQPSVVSVQPEAAEVDTVTEQPDEPEQKPKPKRSKKTEE